MSTCSSKSHSASKPLGVIEAARRYAKLHQKICGVLEPGQVLLPEPANPKYILDGLPPLDELPCFYGLYWRSTSRACGCCTAAAQACQLY